MPKGKIDSIVSSTGLALPSSTMLTTMTIERIVLGEWSLKFSLWAGSFTVSLRRGD